ncbi:Sodium:neurotransmitter symporter family protein [Dictyocaulus viviparus]|uniref:Sodium:neurotransmitter symporter family protein n=1 Tax=Dictyocaulus viviparus TaxID=29172 RepID=A0A0D8XCR1_DICVI|nr:Sodium:neurotransmitter symporter family protein [Dictyocaulus viviparus]
MEILIIIYSESDVNERGHWNNKVEFLLSTVGLAVGLGNIWRFSALAYNNGGNCVIESEMEECKRKDASRPVAFNGTCIPNMLEPMRTPFDQFFTKQLMVVFIIENYEISRNVVTKRSTGIDDLKAINWSAFIGLVTMWCLTFLILIKGYKYMGKAAYFTATAPYIIIVILFFRAITLEGSRTGIYYYLGKPDFSKIFYHQTWSAALIQICFSINTGYGGVLMLSSYNKKDNNCFRVCAFVNKKNTLIMYYKRHSLAFVAYPQAISKMPYPTIWCVLFFLMIFLLGISSEVALVETFCTGIYDQWPSTRRKKWLVSLACCSVSFICGLVMVTEVRFHFFIIITSTNHIPTIYRFQLCYHCYHFMSLFC